MDCCGDAGSCDMDIPCQSCLNLHLVSAVLFKMREFSPLNLPQHNARVSGDHFPVRNILPEIQPPAYFLPHLA